MMSRIVIRKSSAIVLGLCIAISGSLTVDNGAYAATGQPVKGAFQKYSADVTGDKNLETVYVGMEADAEEVFVKVEDSKTKKIVASIVTEFFGAEHDTDLYFQDLNGDKKKEIILSAGGGGSSGDHVCAVYSVTGSKLKAIPLKTASVKADVKISENGTYFMVKPTFTKTTKSMKVDVSYYETVEMGEVTGQYQGPFYTLKDINKDGKVELIESFDYYLVNHGDGLGSLSIYYQYSSKQKAMVPIDFIVN